MERFDDAYPGQEVEEPCCHQHVEAQQYFPASSGMFTARGRGRVAITARYPSGTAPSKSARRHLQQGQKVPVVTEESPVSIKIALLESA